MNKKRKNEKYWSKEGNRKRRRKINRFSMRIEDIKEKRLQEDNVGDHQFTYCTVLYVKRGAEQTVADIL